MGRFAFVSVCIAVSFSALAQTYSPPPELLNSPALLANYAAWMKDQDSFSAGGSETRAYQDLVYSVYNLQIVRDANDLAMLDAELASLRSRVCQNSTDFVFCQSPAKIAAPQDLAELGKSLLDEKLNQSLSSRWKMPVSIVQLPNSSDASFNFEAGPQSASTSANVQYWQMKVETVQWLSITPVLTDIVSYTAGVSNGGDVPAQFALSNSGILINDWQLRNRVMQFASTWKLDIEMNADLPNPVVFPFEYQIKMLFKENQNQFETAYAQLLPLVKNVRDVYQRFLNEKSKGHYPEEIYQHVAFDLFSHALSVQSAYFQLAAHQQSGMSDRQKTLESLLTLQNYLNTPRVFLTELQTLATPFSSHAAWLDQTVDFTMAETFVFEQISVILGLGDYTNTNYFARFGYSLLNDELFNPNYLKENSPALYQKFQQPDGTFKHIADFPPADQIQIFKTYLLNDQGQVMTIALARVTNAYLGQIQVDDLRAIAQIIHLKRYENKQVGASHCHVPLGVDRAARQFGCQSRE